jgi:hypothetical protein
MPQGELQNTQDDPSPDPSDVITSFDELAKGLATGAISRRKALRWMGGALIGAALASFPGVAWANDCRRLGRECRRDSQCCSRRCIRRGDDKVCACPQGQSRCGDRCVNLKTNENHCGSCAKRCGSNQTCCNGNCVNLQRKERHCGSCFNRCDEGEECVRGVCQGRCPSCTTLCGGECVSNVCPPGQFFNLSFCECRCPVDTTLCGGNCVPNCTSEAQTLNCSNCQCEGGACPSGSTEVFLSDFGSICCPNAQVCGTGGATVCCNSPGTTCVNGPFCQTA